LLCWLGSGPCRSRQKVRHRQEPLSWEPRLLSPLQLAVGKQLAKWQPARGVTWTLWTSYGQVRLLTESGNPFFNKVTYWNILPSHC
jgi:hypothetical protein